MRLVLISIYICFAISLFGQNYDDNFKKPIVTEEGDFVYYELLPIQTAEGRFVFLDRNLGALSSDVSSSDSWGDLYQWGRATDGHEKRLSDTTCIIARTYQANNKEFIVDSALANDWLISPEDDLWNDTSHTNNPCPCGYNLPSEKQWRALMNLGYEIKVANSGMYYISIADGQLLLPCAGIRNAFTGDFQYLGTRGFYWALDVSKRGYSAAIDFNKAEITTNVTIYGFRAFGRSVRCMRLANKDE